MWNLHEAATPTAALVQCRIFYSSSSSQLVHYRVHVYSVYRD